MTPGTTLGRYELHRLLGEGGMGRVWQATLNGPAGFTKPVALKVLKDGGDGLVREARLGGLLRHPNLVEVYALERVEAPTGPTWVCAMELIRGGSLKGRVLPPRAVVEVGIAVARGLGHAHREIGLVHLDLKPSNLLLDHGTVKVADLGIARARTIEGGEGVGGTPAYMAPEQRLGGVLDARTDVYSLGVVLTALATGQPSRHPVAVPWLEAVLRGCLPLEPEARFEDMGAVLEALRGLDVEGPGLEDWRSPEHSADVLEAETLDEVSEAPSSMSGTPGSLYRAFTNLGPEPDAFVGREAEQAQLLARLETPGLTTLKGTGGLGKTRLARRVAREWHRASGQPAWFVDLSAATTASDLVHALASTLDVPAGDEDLRPLGWALAAHGPALVVLDNLEQLTAHAAMLEPLLETAPELRLLATSREPLRVRAERVIELSPLSEAEARALLLRRAAEKGARPSASDPALAELVRQLDCLPLALELAATRLSVLDPAGLLRRLDRRFSLLRSRAPGLSRREATLRGTLDWSWEMLSPTERSALVQCAAFAHSFGLDVAEEVVHLADGWVLDALESLVERSLLVAASPGRLRMLISVRAYARSADPEAYEAACGRHIQAFARWGEPAALDALHRPGGLEARSLRLADQDNVMTAARRAVDTGHARAGQLVLAAWSLVRHGGPFARMVELTEGLAARDARVAVVRGAALQLAGAHEEAIAVLDEALASGAPRAEVQRWRALHFRGRGELDAAAEALRDGLPHGDDRQRAMMHGELAVVHHRLGELDAALSAFADALTELQRVGDRVGQARVLGNQGNLFADLGRTEEARRAYERALRRHREARNRVSEAVVRTNLAGLYVELGDLAKAEALYDEALAMHREVGHRAAVAHVLGDLGVLRASRGEDEAAERAYRHAIETYDALGDAAGVAHITYNLGSLLMRTSRAGEAGSHLREARESFATLGDRVGAACAEGLLGGLARDDGDLVAARASLDAAIEVLSTLRQRRLEGSLRGERALVHAHQGDAASSSADLAAGAALLEAADDRPQLGQLAVLEARCAHLLGEEATVESALARATAIADELGLPERAPLRRAIAEAR